MEPKRVDIAAAAADTFAIATRHAPSIIAAVILFLLTLWVPYVNLGTLIALTLLPVRLARDERIEALSIFRSEYRRRMGDFLLTAALKQAALALGTALLVIPGIVLALAWKPAYWCLAEHDKSPLEAIRAAEAATRGSKWRLFALFFAFTLCATVAGSTRRSAPPSGNSCATTCGSSPSRLPGTAPKALFCCRNIFYRKTINIICFSEIKFYLCIRKQPKTRQCKTKNRFCSGCWSSTSPSSSCS